MIVHHRILSSVVLGASLALALLLALAARAPVQADGGSGSLWVPLSLDRPHDPVVVPGEALPGLSGVPLDEVFVYAYQTVLTPVQIPAQIDERTADGVYVPLEDGRLDANDELVFMAADAGGWVLSPTLKLGETSLAPAAVVTLTDPLGGEGWVYLYRSAALTPTVTRYVTYDAPADRIMGQGHYALGFHPGGFFRDYLTLGTGDVDLLDREQVRITVTVRYLGFAMDFSLDEEDLVSQSVHAVVGPVRVTRVATYTLSALGQAWTSEPSALFGYRSLLVSPIELAAAGADEITSMDDLRYSFNLNAHAAGMTYYDPNNPDGVVIDGLPDAITDTPVATWNQVSGMTGTLISVYQGLDTLGELPRTFYRDDRTVEAYGNAGFEVEVVDLEMSHTLQVYHYFQQFQL